MSIQTLTHRKVAAAYDEGRSLCRSWSKTPTQATASGIWFDLSMSPGNPPAQYYVGAPYEAVAMARSTDYGFEHGPNPPTGYKKYLRRLHITTTLSTAAPITGLILDYLMFYSALSMDAGVAEMTTGISLPRYPTGAGVQMMVIELFPYVGAAQIQIRYTNSDGVTGRLTPVITLNTQTTFGTIATSAPATAGVCGPFVTLQSGDTGVRAVEAIEVFGAGDVGTLAIVLVKPLVPVAVFETTMVAEWDFLRDMGFTPIIENDAYLNMIVRPVGTLATAPFTGEIEVFWSAL